MKIMPENEEIDYFVIGLSWLIRIKKTKTQKELSHEAELTVAQVSRIIAGESCGSVETRKRLATAIGLQYTRIEELGKSLCDAESNWQKRVDKKDENLDFKEKYFELLNEQNKLLREQNEYLKRGLASENLTADLASSGDQ